MAIKALRVVITSFAVGAAVAAVAAVAVDYKFQAIRSAPVLGYDSIAVPGDILRVVVRPLLMEETLAEVVAAIGPVPECSLGWVLPREVALLVDPDVENATAWVKLFVNEQRLGPVLHQWASDAARHPSVLDWVDLKVTASKRGTLSLEGAFPIDADIQRLILERWPAPAPAEVVPMEGPYPFQAVLGNRDGGTLAVLLTLLNRLVPEPRPYKPQAIADTLREVISIRIAGETPSPGQLRLNVAFIYAEGTRDEALAKFAFLWDTLFRQMRWPLEQATGLAISGSPSREGLTVFLDMHITGLNKIWAG